MKGIDYSLSLSPGFKLEGKKRVESGAEEEKEKQRGFSHNGRNLSWERWLGKIGS